MAMPTTMPITVMMISASISENPLLPRSGCEPARMDTLCRRANPMSPSVLPPTIAWGGHAVPIGPVRVSSRVPGRGTPWRMSLLDTHIRPHRGAACSTAATPLPRAFFSENARKNADCKARGRHDPSRMAPAAGVTGETFCGRVGPHARPPRRWRGRALRVEQPELRPRRRAPKRGGGELRLPRVDPCLARSRVEQRPQLRRVHALAAHARVEPTLVQLAAADLAQPS